MLTARLTVRRVIRDNIAWLIFAAALFFISSVVVYRMPENASELTDAVINAKIGGLETLVDWILQMPPVAAALFVFLNNLVSMVQMLVLGFAAGLSPILTLCLNGGLVGAMAAMAVREGLPLLQLLVVTIVPHGVFELSAFFLCGGLGLKSGYRCTVSPLPGSTRKESFKYIWKEALTVLPLVVVLLFVAAFVEIFVTGYLVERALPVAP